MNKKFKIPSFLGISAIILMLIVVIVGFKSLQTVGSGERAAVFYKWSSGVDTIHVLAEGTHLIAPWNDLIIYDVRQKNEDMKLSTIQYHPMSNKVGKIDISIGKGYKDVIIVPKSRSSIRQAAGNYTAEEIYSTKRANFQADCELMISKVLEKNNLILDAVNIRDVGIPKKITDAILLKQEQEQKNLRAKMLEQEAKFQADAKKQTAIGDSIQIVTLASAQANAIKLKQEQLRKSPQYTEYIKWLNYSKKGVSPYGENNIFGSNTAIVKGLK